MNFTELHRCFVLPSLGTHRIWADLWADFLIRLALRRCRSHWHPLVSMWGRPCHLLCKPLIRKWQAWFFATFYDNMTSRHIATVGDCFESPVS